MPGAAELAAAVSQTGWIVVAGGWQQRIQHE